MKKKKELIKRHEGTVPNGVDSAAVSYDDLL